MTIFDLLARLFWAAGLVDLAIWFAWFGWMLEGGAGHA